MDLPSLIAQFGYAAVLVGTVLEGETVLLLAGYSAHRGYLDFAAVVGIAWLGGALGDQFFFWLGRRHGQRLIARRPLLRTRVERAFTLIERYPVAVILTMRFMWGLRMALPIAIGISRVGWRRFLWLDLLSSALWAPLVAGIGWAFGALLERDAAMLRHYEHWVMAGMAAAALLLRLIVRRARFSGAAQQRDAVQQRRDDG
jgi:membrane protein DedA with SNARE-associated domain